MAAATGAVPLLDDTSNLSVPLVALVPAAPAWLAGGLGPAILFRFALWPWRS